jgi:hypothetical protein
MSTKTVRIATERLYRTADGRVVLEGDPDAAFLLAAPGHPVPDDVELPADEEAVATEEAIDDAPPANDGELEADTPPAGAGETTDAPPANDGETKAVEQPSNKAGKQPGNKAAKA